MTDVNPYGPPTTTTEAVVPGRGRIDFEEYEAQVIRTMCKGMKVVSVLQYSAAGLLVILVSAFFLVGSMGRLLLGSNPLVRLMAGAPTAILAVVLVLVVLAATWLLQSSRAFVQSLKVGTTDGLARGFQKLHLYFILYGVFSIISLGTTLLGLVGIGMVARLGSGL